MSASGRIPYVITQAITRLVMNKFDTPHDFSRRAVTTLKAILSYVSGKNGLTPIFPKREKLAERCQYDQRTVQRALKELIDAGWLRRMPQERKRRAGRVTNDFSVVPLALTEAACFALQLPFSSAMGSAFSSPEKGLESKPDALLITSSGATKSADAIKHNQPKADQGSSHSVSSKQKDCGSANSRKIRIGQYTIPADLVWLVNVGLLPLKHVFFLMKQFSLKGIRLQDVLQLLEMRIALLKGKDLFAYLHAISKKDIDWKAKLAHIGRTQKRHENKVKSAEVLRWGKDNLAGKSFVHCSSTAGDTLIRFFMAGKELWFEEKLPDERTGTQVALSAHVRAVRDGKLMPYVEYHAKHGPWEPKKTKAAAVAEQVTRSAAGLLKSMRMASFQ